MTTEAWESIPPNVCRVYPGLCETLVRRTQQQSTVRTCRIKELKLLGKVPTCHLLKSDLSKFVNFGEKKAGLGNPLLLLLSHDTQSTKSNILLTEKRSQELP